MEKLISKDILFFGFFVAIILQSCASSGSIGDQPHIYSQPFNEMTEVVEGVVRGNGLNIERVFRAKEGSEVTLIVNKYVSVGGKSVQKHQGIVIITELQNNKVEVEVENPEYHYTVPQYLREKYDRIIFRGINATLQKG